MRDTRWTPLLQISERHSFNGYHRLGPRREVLVLCEVQHHIFVKWIYTQYHSGRLVYQKAMSNIVPYTIGLHTGNPAPFLYTPTSLLPEHSVLTDVQQATGRNGQQWITCRSGGQGTRPQIWMGSDDVVPLKSTNNTITIGLDTQIPNGLYHCLSDHSERKYFSLFLRNPGMCMQHICSLSEHTVQIMCMHVYTLMYSTF